MRVSALGFCLVLLATVSASAQTPSPEPTPPPPNATYFIIDASGSMRGENQSDATDVLRGEAALLPRDQLLSVTYFGGRPRDPGQLNPCAEHIVPSSFVTRGSALPTFPELGGSNDKTSIGNALESILSVADLQARVVLITDGAEECDTDFAAVRQKYPETEIKVLQVGKNPNPTLQSLQMAPPPELPSEPTSAEPIQLPLSVALVPPTLEPEARWDQRLWWVIVVAMSALAAVLFCLQSGERTKNLQE